MTSRFQTVLLMGLLLVGFLGVTQAEAALVAYLPMSENSGTATADATGNGYDATISDSTMWTDTSGNPNGSLGTGLSFGSGDYASVAQGLKSADMGNYAELTVEAWIKVTGGADSHRIIFQAYESVSSAMIEFKVNRFNRIYFEIYSGSSSYAQSANDAIGTAADYGTWHHVAGRMDAAGVVDVFIDGVGVTNTSGDGLQAPTLDTGTMAIGVQTDTTSFPFSGTIDELAIYSTALSDALILDHYNNPPIPEPATLAVFSIGGLLSLLRRRRA